MVFLISEKKMIQFNCINFFCFFFSFYSPASTKVMTCDIGRVLGMTPSSNKKFELYSLTVIEILVAPICLASWLMLWPPSIPSWV